MKRLLPALLFTALLAPDAARAQSDAADDRSTAFVAAEAPSETFGPVEGPVLFAGACAVVCLGLAFLLAGARVHSRCSRRLDAAFARVGEEDGHA
ncbi:MAG: hypothetical protein PHU25_20010 [Deltaproteobacteria bacterium]|nr:hypothetical protein [Deltaproteobacteria bacterium]